MHADGVGWKRTHYKENTEVLQVASKETGLKVNAEKTKYMIMSRDSMQDITI
jgi:hypothetical protein